MKRSQYKDARFKRTMNMWPDKFKGDLKIQSMRQCMQGLKGADAASWWRELRAMRWQYRDGPGAKSQPIWI